LPRASEDIYFSEKNKPRVVGDFAVSYLNNDAQVQTRKFVRDLKFTGHGLYESSRFIDAVNRKIQCGMVFDDYEEDERFKDIPKMCAEYAKIDLTKPRRRALTDKLYGVIITLMSEHRLSGEFKLQPYRDWELSRIQDRLNELEGRQTNRGGLNIPK
jgi:hypothetical protein